MRTHVPTEIDRDSIPPIEITDRCDRCANSRSYVAVMIPVGDQKLRLDFCAHHYRQHSEVLEGLAVAIRNEEDKINLKPSVSANA